MVGRLPVQVDDLSKFLEPNGSSDEANDNFADTVLVLGIESEQGRRDSVSDHGGEGISVEEEERLSAVGQAAEVTGIRQPHEHTVLFLPISPDKFVAVRGYSMLGVAIGADLMICVNDILPRHVGKPSGFDVLK